MSTHISHDQAATGSALTQLKSASPVAAAAFAAGIAYAWLEALWRLLLTYNPDFSAKWSLWNGRVGDIAAMWLTISVLAALVGVGLYWLWRNKDRIGFIMDWTVVLIGSAIAAPMIGEIGTPAGSVATGNGSASAVAVIAYTLLGLVIIVCSVVIARLHRRP